MRRPLRLSLWFLVLCLAVLLYLPGVDGPLLLDDKLALAENERAQIGGAVLDEWRTAALSSDSGPLRRRCCPLPAISPWREILYRPGSR